MLHIVRCEWLRIKKTCLFALVLNLLLLLLLVNFGLLFSVRIGLKISLVVAYGMFALLFAVTQMRLYRQDSQWIYLLNRPLSDKAVFTALLVSAVALFLVAIVLPMLLVTIGLDVFSGLQIDRRHYLQLFYILGVCISCYLAGCFITLSPSKWVAIVLILPILTLMSLNLGGHVFVLQALVIFWLLLLVLLVFKVNLQHMKQQGFLGFFLVLAMQFCAFMMLSSLISMVELTVTDIRYMSNQNNDPIAGEFPHTFHQTTYLNSQQKIAASLSELPARERQAYEVAMSLSETFRIRKRVWFHPTKQQLQLMDERGLLLTEEGDDLLWNFSHDEMLFVGKNKTTLQPIGFLGPNKSGTLASDFSAAERFTAIPWITGNQFIVGNKQFHYDAIKQSVENTFAAKEGELLLNVIQQQGSIYSVISDQSLYVFDAIEIQQQHHPFQAVLVMDLPGDYNNLWDITVTEVKDKFLLSFLYGKDPRTDAYLAKQLTYEFDLSGQVELITERQLARANPEFIRYLDYLLSPLWTVTTDRLQPLPARDRYLEERPWPLPLPNSIVGLMAVLAVLYFMLTVYWARVRRLSWPTTVLWSCTNALSGIPGLMAFRIINSATEPLIQSSNESLKRSQNSTVELPHV